MILAFICLQCGVSAITLISLGIFIDENICKPKARHIAKDLAYIIPLQSKYTFKDRLIKLYNKPNEISVLYLTILYFCSYISLLNWSFGIRITKPRLTTILHSNIRTDKFDKF